MKGKEIGAPVRSHCVVLAPGEKAMESLTRYATENGISAARITAIGAVSDVEMGYYNRQAKDYDRHAVHTQMELLSFLGDIALNDGAPQVHVHVVLSRPDGTCLGGHLFEATIWPTLEVFIDEYETPLTKMFSEETGLFLIAPEG